MVKKSVVMLTLVTVAFLVIGRNGFCANYTGGSDEGWEMDTMSSNVVLLGTQVTISSETNQTLERGITTPISTITITDDPTSPGISTGISIRVRIPSASDLSMTWDETDLTPTFGGSALTNVGGISYADSGKTLVITVTADFSAGDTLTINDLSFKGAYGGPANLELDFDSDGVVDAVDDKTITITAFCFYSGAEDGFDLDNMTEDKDLFIIPGTMFMIK